MQRARPSAAGAERTGPVGRSGLDLLVALGFEEPLGVGAVGLVEGDVGTRVLWRKQQDGVPEGLELTPPVMRRAAGLHQDGCRLTLGEEAQKCVPGQTVSLGDPTRVAGDGDLEHGLRQVDRDRRILHLGLLLPNGVL